MYDYCTDIGYVSLNKFGEAICGDHVEVVQQESGGSVVVLADGLGSGVKANILSTITSKIIATMMANRMSVAECVATIAATLPICKVRKIAYSTFSIIRISENLEAEIIQYDNPHVIMLRKGQRVDYGMTSEVLDGKVIYKSTVRMEENDTFIALSDGAVHAGVGLTLNFGWTRDNIVDYIEKAYREEHTAKTISAILANECFSLYEGQPGDDTTVVTVRVRKRSPLNMMIGPPANPEDLNSMMSLFFAKEGKRIVCGGTTSALAAEFLGKPLIAELPEYMDAEIPPTAEIAGVDLVTEGVITINRVLSYAKDYLQDNACFEDWSQKKDGASRIARLLFEDATDINFFVGRAINPAHQNPNLPITFSIKMQLVQELSDCLTKMGKNIKISFF